MPSRCLPRASTVANTAAGVAQVVRIRCHTQIVRQAKVIKQTDDVRFAVTSYGAQEAGPDALLKLARDHWSMENGPHYRRDRTQDEDRCPVRDPSHCASSLPVSVLGHLSVQTASQRQGRAPIAPRL